MAPGTLGGCGMVVNRGAFARLPPEWQQALLDAKPGAYEALKKGSREADAKNLPMFRQQGLIEVRYTDEQLDRFREVEGRPVWDAWVEAATTTGMPGKALLALLLDESRKAAGGQPQRKNAGPRTNNRR